MRIATCALLAASLFAASCAVGSGPNGSLPADLVGTEPLAHTTNFVEGTVFWGPSSKDPVDRAFVRIIDSASTTRCVVTGCDGRFALPRADALALTLPIRIGVERAVEPELRTPTSLVSREMFAPIREAAPCASCHGGSERQVHLYGSEEEAAASRLAPSGSCAPHAVPHLVECPEDRL